MSGKGKMDIEDVEVEEESTQKPSWNHLEKNEIGEDQPTQKPSWNHASGRKPAREPYWDTPYVIGASRNLSSGEYAPQEKTVRAPGLWKRLWIHYKRYWVFYAIAGVIFLAVFLPVL